MTQESLRSAVAADHIAFEWSLGEDSDLSTDEVARVKSALEESGGSVTQSDQGDGFIVPLLVALFGVVVITALAEQVYTWWDHVHDRGLFLHAYKNGRVKIEPIDVPWGTIILLDAKGETFTVKDVSRDTMEKILDTVKAGLSPDFSKLLPSATKTGTTTNATEGKPSATDTKPVS
jgi:hypothetical protein